MADESIPMPEVSKEVLSPETEIPVPVDSLEADGVRPEMDDQVTIRIEGKITRIENDCAYITPQKVNDKDLNEILAEKQSENEDSMMERITSDADRAGLPMGGGY
jgi:hypothetical protein